MWPFSALKRAKREKILLKKPIPDELWDWAISEHRIFQGLSEEDRAGLRALATIFLAEKRFYPEPDVDMDPRIEASIAVQACLPILKLGIESYDDWETIYLSAKEYIIQRKDYLDPGLVAEYDDEVSGEVLELGPIVLSVKDVDASGWGDGYNVVIHEMAHKLDGRNGSLDAMPLLPKGIRPWDWQATFEDAFEKERKRSLRPRKKRRGMSPEMDEYAAEDIVEFFAVSCEYFFEKPRLLKEAYPDVYALLALYFRQDPSLRL